MKAAATINAAGHPSSLNLQPVEKADGGFRRWKSAMTASTKYCYCNFPRELALRAMQRS